MDFLPLGWYTIEKGGALYGTFQRKSVFVFKNPSFFLKSMGKYSTLFVFASSRIVLLKAVTADFNSSVLFFPFIIQFTAELRMPY